jgi:hypothetical protein
MRVAEMCNVTIDTNTYHFPEFHPPAGMELDEYFEDLARQGFEKRMPEIRAAYDSFGEGLLDQYRKRFDYEAGVIRKTGFSGTSSSLPISSTMRRPTVFPWVRGAVPPRAASSPSVSASRTSTPSSTTSSSSVS